MFEKLRVIICFFLILRSNATLVTLAVKSCSTNGDCPKSYHCDEGICKKCLSCGLLFRKGNSCVMDFTECKDCLPGYEEISLTINSVIKKPCKLVNKNKTATECLNPKSCPPNNYCSEGSCVKCFNCNVVNRLPPVNNCATALTECGSCRNGYQEVSVTTLKNFKPCDPENVKVLESEFTEYVEEVVVLGVVLIFLMTVLIFYIHFKKNCKVGNSSKSISLCAAIPSAPPLHALFEDQAKENTVKTRGVKIEESNTEHFNLSYENEQMQQAKVFQQPNAAYYNAYDERSHESSLGNQSLEIDVRRLSIQLGINPIRDLPFFQRINEAAPETDRSSSGSSDMRQGVLNDNRGVEIDQPDSGDVGIVSPAQQPSEMNVQRDTDCDDNTLSMLH